jgi:hypothetical protein
MAAVLIAVPIYPKFPFINVPGIYVSIRLEDFLILAISILWLIKNFRKIIKLIQNPIPKAIVIFLMVGFISTLSGITFLKTVSPLIGLLQWGRRVEYLIGFFIALSSIKGIKDLEFYIKCLGIVICIVFFVGVAQKYFTFPVITTQNSEYSKGIALRYVPGGHLVSTFAGHYDLATYIILTSPIFVAFYFSKENAKKEKIAFLSLIAMSFWLMINAASRISAVSYVLAISTTLFILKKYKYIPIVAAITLFFAFSTSNLFDRYLNIFEVIKRKLTSFPPKAYAQSGNMVSRLPETPPPSQTVFEDRSTSIRLAVEWPRAIRAFLKNPILGTGYGSITLATDNDYLRILGETGILGAISSFFVYARIVKDHISNLWKSNSLERKRCYLAGIAGVLPGVFLNAVFIDIFEASKFAIPFWILVGFSLALIHENKFKKNN